MRFILAMDFNFTPHYDQGDGLGISPDFHWDDFNSIVFEGNCQEFIDKMTVIELYRKKIYLNGISNSFRVFSTVREAS